MANPIETLDIGKVWNQFMEFLRSHGFRVFVSLITGAFTYHAGYTLTESVVYAAALVVMAEGLSLWYPFSLEGAKPAFLGSIKKINVSGFIQWSAAILGIALSWTSIILTDLASATFIANEANIKFGGLFSAFENIPIWSQQIVVYVLPVLGVCHALLLTAFYIFSPEAEHARTLRSIRRSADEKIKTANAKALEAQATAEANEYTTKAFQAAEKAGRAKANARLANEFNLKEYANDSDFTQGKDSK